MAPKTKYTKQEIIHAAFDIAKKEGFSGITIRKVARELESSIAPIYSNFEDVEQLKKAVVDKSIDLAKQVITEQDSGDPFRDIGIASIQFAKQYSVLYRDLIMNHNPYMKYNEENTLLVVEQMKKDPQLATFSDKDLQQGLLKIQIFQTGLSVMAANDLLPEQFNEPEMIAILDELTQDIFISASLRQEQSEIE